MPRRTCCLTLLFIAVAVLPTAAEDDVARLLKQVRAVATRLEGLGAPVSVADHLGFLRDWYIVGPFDARGVKGFQTTYPPEEKVDLAESYKGKGKAVGWKRYHSPETTEGTHVALVNLREPLGDAADGRCLRLHGL
jgi:hypothetical protein